MKTSSGYEAGEKRTTREVLRALFRSRKVLRILVQRDLTVRYSESLLGYLWSVLEPLALAAIYWFVFTQIFVRNVGAEPYIVYLLAGMLPWMWFQSGVTRGAQALLTNSRLVASTALPRQVWVIRIITSTGIEFLLSIPVFVIFALIFPPELNQRLLFIPLAVIIQYILLLGLGLLLSPIMVLVRDLQPLIRLGTRLLFFSSPIIYGLNDVLARDVPAFLKAFYRINPIAGITEAYRAGFFNYEPHFEITAIAAGTAVVTLILGWVVFARLEHRVLKEI